VHSLGLVADLLAQVVGVPPTAVVGVGELDRGGDLRRRPRVEREGAKAIGRDRRQLAVLEEDDLLGVAHEGGDVGGDEHLAVADAEHHGRAVAGHQDAVGHAGVADGDAISAFDLTQGGADAVVELVAFGARDEVGQHLGVGVGGELDSLGLEHGPQARGVLDDAVVHDGHAALGVAVRMGVDVARRTVRRPTGVGDP